jgi:RHS repeat-associated protein
MMQVVILYGKIVSIAFGETRYTSGTMYTDKLFTGQRQMAELGIYYYNARFYSPYINRFLSADTIVPGYTNPQALNRFSYVLNNPLRYIDPTGHMITYADGGGGGSYTSPSPVNYCTTHPGSCWNNSNNGGNNNSQTPIPVPTPTTTPTPTPMPTPTPTPTTTPQPPSTPVTVSVVSTQTPTVPPGWYPPVSNGGFGNPIDTFAGPGGPSNGQFLQGVGQALPVIGIPAIAVSAPEVDVVILGGYTVYSICNEDPGNCTYTTSIPQPTYPPGTASPTSMPPTFTPTASITPSPTLPYITPTYMTPSSTPTYWLTPTTTTTP